MPHPRRMTKHAQENLIRLVRALVPAEAPSNSHVSGAPLDTEP